MMEKSIKVGEKFTREGYSYETKEYARGFFKYVT